MKKLTVIYGDDSKATYTMKNSTDHMKYVTRHKIDICVKTIVLQQYPLKDNEPIVFK